MSAHTPGPWHVESPALSVVDAERIEVAVARAYGDQAEAEANARLIAAAPDLLEALRAALDALEYRLSDAYKTPPCV